MQVIAVIYIGIMLAVWGYGAYCSWRCWTPQVRVKWDKRRQAGWTLPQSIPTPDVLGPTEQIWYDRANRCGGIFLAMLVGPIVLSLLWSKIVAQ